MPSSSSRSCAVALVGLIGAIACSGEGAERGQLMLVLQTDLGVPHDVTRFNVLISVDGAIQHDRDYVLSPTGQATLPGSIAVVAPQREAPRVEVRLVSFDGAGNARTFTKIVTQIPRQRVAMLRLPLAWLCLGGVLQSGQGADAAYFSKCEPKNGVEQSCLAGECRDVQLAESELPDYDSNQVFGGGTYAGDAANRCFDVQACFEESVEVRPVLRSGRDYCSATLDVPASHELSFAVSTGDNGPGICADTHGRPPCYVAVDRDDTDGWKVQGKAGANAVTVKLPPALCDRLKVDARLTLRASAACLQKNPELPSCGAWSSAGSAVAVEPIELPTLESDVAADNDACLSAAASGEEPLIDDFEDGDAALAPHEGRVGNWAVFGDAPSLPTIGDPFSTKPSGANGSARSLAVRSPAAPGSSAGLSAYFNDQSSFARFGHRLACPYDVSSYSGLSFWARSALSRTARVSIPTVTSASPDQGGVCRKDCNDFHGSELELSAGWKRYTITFAELVQQAATGGGFEPAEALGVRFDLGAADAYDFELDEVRFIP